MEISRIIGYTNRLWIKLPYHELTEHVVVLVIGNVVVVVAVTVTVTVVVGVGYGLQQVATLIALTARKPNNKLMLEGLILVNGYFDQAIKWSHWNCCDMFSCFCCCCFYSSSWQTLLSF